MSISRPVAFVIALILMYGKDAGAGFTLGGSTAATGLRYYDDASGQTITFSARAVTHINTPVAGDQFSSLFSSQIGGWTLSYGGGLSGSLDFASNAASNSTNGDGSKNAVLTETATYTRGSFDPKDLTFIQYFTTTVINHDGTPDKYIKQIDNGIGTKDGLPTYYNNQLMLNNGLTFKDAPQDPMPSAANSYQLYINNYYTYLCTFDSTAKTLKVNRSRGVASFAGVFEQVERCHDVALTVTTICLGRLAGRGSNPHPSDAAPD